MRIIKLSSLIMVSAGIMLVTGCGPDANDLKIQNNRQSRVISELESQAAVSSLEMEKLKRTVDSAQEVCDAQTDALEQRITSLGEDISNKSSLIALMQQRLLSGGAQIPIELSTMLEDFANTQEMVTYDAGSGIVKFKSDLLFKSGKDKVLGGAEKAVKELCVILNSEQAKGLDVVIAGHTDDQPIRYSRAVHASNWHLSSNRAISVLKVMEANKVAPNRMSARGFGEYRPVEANKPGKKGNPKNRRVEIYIVPKGM
ncbi:flagellar motor protein MotB [Planctomycetota bacterium]